MQIGVISIFFSFLEPDVIEPDVMNEMLEFDKGKRSIVQPRFQGYKQIVWDVILNHKFFSCYLLTLPCTPRMVYHFPKK